MRRFAVVGIKTGELFGFISRATKEEALKAIKNKEPYVSPKIQWKEYTIGFSDQWLVYNVEFKAVTSYNPSVLTVTDNIIFDFDRFIGTRMESRKDDYTGFDVISTITNKIKIGEIDHFSKFPDVTRPALLAKKQNRHWYFTGWRITINKVTYIQVRNLINDLKGFVRVDKGLVYGRTALETNFSTLQTNLLQVEKTAKEVGQKVKDKIIDPITDAYQDAKEGVTNALQVGKIGAVALGIYFLTSKLT